MPRTIQYTWQRSNGITNEMPDNDCLHTQKIRLFIVDVGMIVVG